jgi:asparagine synthase (glutamine-hydrolysing)
MPGIVGIISREPSDECQRFVTSMVASMKHEQFYTSGMYAAPEIGIYAGWVAHGNSFAAGQVFFNESKDISLIFSGECFVDPGIRSDLRRKGHKLNSNNDWLVHFYEEEGEEFFERLNGLFSGLLIDKRQSKAFLFNDRYGMERIYFCETKDTIYFASEAKALLRILPELRTFDEEGVAQFLTYGCTLEWRTLFRGVQLLPGGSVWSFKGGNCHKRKYFSPETWEAQPALSVESFESEFQETFKRILPRYFESGSKIGISLTGGLDTRMIMACLPETAEKPICYTFSGEKGLTLDDRLASRVAESCGLEHRLLRIGPDFFSDFAAHADRTVYITDGSFGVLGTHEIYLNKQARELAAVRLTGNYGSELLRGVSTFKPMGLSPRLFGSGFRATLGSSLPSIVHNGEHPLTFTAFREIPWNLLRSRAAARSQVTFRTPYLDNELVALAYQAPDGLRKSSLPASRFVKANSAVLSQIPTDRGFVGDNSGVRFLVRRVFAEATFKIDYYNSEGLPHGLSRLDSAFRRLSSSLGVLGLHKYLPYRHWFRRELAGYINDKLTDPRTRRMPFWNSDFLESMADDHIRGRKNYAHEINAVLTLDAVERCLFRREGMRSDVITCT